MKEKSENKVVTEEKNKVPTYKLKEDKKMLGIILLIIASTMQIFAFLEVPFFTTIHSYTIGMLLGSYNPFFYLYVIYFATIMIFSEKVSLPSWVRLTKLSYLFVAIAVTFIGSSSWYFQTKIKDGWTVIGFDSWKLFPKWFHMFTDGQSAWYPHNINGGILGAFLFSFTAMISSGIGSFIISIILLVISISILASGTGIGLYRDLIKKRNLDLKKHRIDDEKKVSFDRLEVTTRKDFEEPEQKVEKETKKDKPVDLPFDDPFA